MDRAADYSPRLGLPRTFKDRVKPVGVEKVKLSAKALVVWLTAMCVYIVAIAGRTSFGVAGVHAIDRFDIDASRLAVFTSVQVGVLLSRRFP